MAGGKNEGGIHPLLWIGLVTAASLATLAIVIASLFDVIPGIF